MFNQLIEKIKSVWRHLFGPQKTEDFPDILMTPQPGEMSMQSDAFAPSSPEQMEDTQQLQSSTIGRKKFDIHGERTTRSNVPAQPSRSGKKFEIESQSTDSRFKKHAMTRPKKCPACHEKQITRLPSGEWKCKVDGCGYIWG